MGPPRGDAPLLHQPLGVELGRLDPRRRLARTNDGQPRILEPVHYAHGQGRLRTNYRQVYMPLAGGIHQCGHVGCRNRQVLRDFTGAGVAGGNEEILYLRAVAQLPRDGVLASPVADHQDVHRSTSRRPGKSAVAMLYRGPSRVSRSQDRRSASAR